MYQQGNRQVPASVVIKVEEPKENVFIPSDGTGVLARKECARTPVSCRPQAVHLCLIQNMLMNM